MVRQEEKIGALKYLLSAHIKPDQLTIVFFATRHHVEFFHEILNQSNIKNTVIYGSMDHSARNINLAKFRNGSINVLLVTDVAARGIGSLPPLLFPPFSSFPSSILNLPYIYYNNERKKKKRKMKERKRKE